MPNMSKIIFQKSGVELNWTGDEESILEFAESNDLDLDYGCRMGNCTACQQKIVSGAVEYPMGHSGEPDEGNALLCCCAPKGDSDLVIGA
ncbi:MAG: ferredoxin [Lentimonas sp.]|jgi:ferredoxin